MTQTGSNLSGLGKTIRVIRAMGHVPPSVRCA
jgi:hypothetical protein